MSPETNQVFENEKVKVEVSRLPGCQIKFQINVKEDFVKKLYNQSLKQVNKEISLPGFRKGKAPDQMILKHFKPQVESEWRNLAINESFVSAIELSKIPPRNKDSIKKHTLQNLTLNGGVLSVEFETWPAIPSITNGEIEQIKVKKTVPRPISEREVEDNIQGWLRKEGKWEEVLDRSIQEGDAVEIRMEERNPPDHLAATEGHCYLVKGEAAEWLIKALVGKNKGDVVETVNEWDPLLEETRRIRKEDFVPMQIRIEIRKISKVEPAEFNEEFIKKLGADSSEDLKVKLRKNLESNAEAAERNKTLRLLETELTARYPVELPTSLLENAIKNEKEQMKNSLSEQKFSPEAIDAFIKENSNKIHETAYRSLNLQFLCQEIVQKNQLFPTNEEIVNQINNQIKYLGPYYAKLFEDEAFAKKAYERTYQQIQGVMIEDFLYNLISKSD